MTDTKRATTANASHRPLNMQEWYDNTYIAGDCKAGNDNKAALANRNGAGAVNVYIPVDEFFTAAFMTRHLPAWLLQRLSVNLAEAAALQTLREANDNTGGGEKAG